MGEAISRFTNLIVTAVSSLGRCHKAILYTRNQAFRRDRNSTKKRDAQVAYLDKVLQEYQVEPRRCVYVGKVKKEDRTLVHASKEVLQLFLEAVQVDPGKVWLSDNGKEFWPKEGSSLASENVEHLSYPAPVHQYLSPNDNNYHAAAKAKWRAMELDYCDDVRASVALLHCLDSDAVHMRGYFETNMQLGQSVPGVEKVAQVIGGNVLKNNSFFKECLYEYCTAFQLDGRGLVERDEDDGLDGRYWQ